MNGKKTFVKGIVVEKEGVTVLVVPHLSIREVQERSRQQRLRVLADRTLGFLAGVSASLLVSAGQRLIEMASH